MLSRVCCAYAVLCFGMCKQQGRADNSLAMLPVHHSIQQRPARLLLLGCCSARNQAAAGETCTCACMQLLHPVSTSAGLPPSPVSNEIKLSCTDMPRLPRTDSYLTVRLRTKQYVTIAVLQPRGPFCVRNPCSKYWCCVDFLFARLCLGHSVCLASSQQVLAHGL